MSRKLVLQYVSPLTVEVIRKIAVKCVSVSTDEARVIWSAYAGLEITKKTLIIVSSVLLAPGAVATGQSPQLIRTDRRASCSNLYPPIGLKNESRYYYIVTYSAETALYAPPDNLEKVCWGVVCICAFGWSGVCYVA